MRFITWWKTRLWWVRWITYTVILVSLFYGIEDFRGYRALEKAKEEYLAAGLRLDLDEIRGTAIPDEENFAASDIIREAYADPNGPGSKLFPEGSLPERPSDASEVEYHGFHGKEWEFSDSDAKEKFDEECREALRTISPQLTRYFEAAMRPSCDWWAVTDPSDFEAPSPHLVMVLNAARVHRIYPNDPDSENIIPISKFELIIGNLAAARHLKTKSTLLNQLVGTVAGKLSLGNLAGGIRHRDFTAGNLDAITERLESIKPKLKRSFIEFETAVGVSRYGAPSESRRIYLKQLEFGFGMNPMVEFPDLPFDLDLSTFESICNRMVVSLLPRGWLRQGQALHIRTVLGTSNLEPNPLYTLLWFDDGDYIPRLIEREEAFQVMTQLALLAIDVERNRLTFGELPNAVHFKTNSPNIGYCIEANGQPMLWYSESLPLGPPPTEKALENYDEKHLWRYPPPES